VQVATPLLPLRLQGVKGPDLVLVMVTEPVGVTRVPGLVSDTVTEQIAEVPASRLVGVQLTETEVVRWLTVRVVDPVAPFAQPEPDLV
jgi:hypothetical protein